MGVLTLAKAAANVVARLALMAIFALFIYGVFMRYVLDRPQSFVDEAVTLLPAWLIFFSAAFVLKWSELISFDILVNALPVRLRRYAVAAALIGYAGIVAAALYPIADYVMFMKIVTTDMLQLRLDFVYSIFVVFLAATGVRALVFAVQLVLFQPERALAALSGDGADLEAPR